MTIAQSATTVHARRIRRRRRLRFRSGRCTASVLSVEGEIFIPGVSLVCSVLTPTRYGWAMSSLTIGLVYENFETYPRVAGEAIDAHVEFEPDSTVEALEEAIRFLGHSPARLGSPAVLMESPGTAARGRKSPGKRHRPFGVDAVFNIAEGFGGRNREAWAPVLLEMAGIPTLGSDALTLSLTLDKAWANRWVGSAGIRVADQISVAQTEDLDRLAPPAEFPLFVKPRWEGTAKGIRVSSRVEDHQTLISEVQRIWRDYRQPALVEAFVPGAEYTVTLIGNDPVEALPVVQRALETETGIGLHALEGLGGAGGPLEYEVSGDLDAALEERLGNLAQRVFETFECHDFARVDFRLDADGEPVFLEINPLPTFATDGTFGILAELEGVSLSEMLARCVTTGLERLGLA
jgi:D-alanine-D-alanine ligase